jgi:hypothetical protein
VHPNFGGTGAALANYQAESADTAAFPPSAP